MLQNAYFLAKFGFGTAENEPAKHLQTLGNFANHFRPLQARDPAADGPAGDALRPAGPGRGLLARWLVDGGASGILDFGKMSLLFGCIGTDLCEQIRVFQHFLRSTRLGS